MGCFDTPLPTATATTTLMRQVSRVRQWWKVGVGKDFGPTDEESRSKLEDGGGRVPRVKTHMVTHQWMAIRPGVKIRDCIFNGMNDLKI